MLRYRHNIFISISFLLSLVIIPTTKAVSSFDLYQRISGARYTSELGTFQFMYEELCVRSCSITLNCLSASYNREYKTCDLGSTLIDTGRTVDNPDWDVFYRRGFPQCQSGLCFEVVVEEMTWHDANEFCKTQHPGGHLANIKSQSDQLLLMSVLPQAATYDLFWIGARDTKTEGTYLWTDDTPVSYTNWNTDQPDNSGDVEDCIMAYSASRQSTWNDLNCGRTEKSVCQFSETT